MKAFILPCAAVLLLLVLPGCGKPADAKREPPVPVIAELVARQTVADYVDTFGHVEPEVRSNVGSTLPGRIVEMTQDVGDLVRGGGLLARLDTSLLDAEARRLDAETRLAEADRDLAEKNWARSDQLFKQGATTQSKLDQDRAALEVAQAKVEARKAARNEVQVRIAQSSIYAPADDVVIRKLADAGDVVNPGQPLYLLECIRDLKVNVVVPERDEPAVRPGKPVEITFDALPGRRFAGAIHALIPSGDPAAHSFTAEIRLRNHTASGPLPEPLPAGLSPDQLLIKPGMFARVKITKYEKADAVVVPQRCVVEEGGEAFVFVIGADGRVQKTAVEPGVPMDPVVEVLKGLEPGQRVVGRGVENMTPGQPVRIMSVAGETADAKAAPPVRVTGAP